MQTYPYINFKQPLIIHPKNSVTSIADNKNQATLNNPSEPHYFDCLLLDFIFVTS